MSRRRRTPNGPGPTATNATLSRPKAPLNSSASSVVATETPRPNAVNRRRPASALSRAKSRSATSPRRTASPTRSNPATARPARRAKPSASQQRRASKASMRSANSGGTITGRRAARANSRFVTARSTISRRGSNHKPRPGKRASISGMMSPSGPTTKRNSASRSCVSPVTMQRRCGDSSAGSGVVSVAAGVVAVTPSPPALALRPRTTQAVGAPPLSSHWPRRHRA